MAELKISVDSFVNNNPVEKYSSPTGRKLFLDTYFDEIKALSEKGYDKNGIADFLKANGIKNVRGGDISATSVYQYLVKKKLIKTKKRKTQAEA